MVNTIRKSKENKRETYEFANMVMYIILIIYAASIIIAFWMIIATSFTSKKEILERGFTLFPKKWSLEAYEYALKKPDRIIKAYGVTIFSCVVGTILALIVETMIAYALSRRSFKYRRVIMLYLFFTMLFSGGLAPTYIWITQYLHLNNTLLVYILPSLIGVFDVILFRTFFMQLPEGLFESAKIDGASEFQIYWKIAIPLSKPIIATLAFLSFNGRWNDWGTPLYYITNPDLYNLQYFLQEMLMSVQSFLAKIKADPLYRSRMLFMKPEELPEDNLKMAMLVIATGPMLFIFSFFQKYFVRGITVGSLK